MTQDSERDRAPIGHASTPPGARENGSPSGDDDSGTASGPASIETRVIEAIQTCYDPEIPVNIYDLGLIYGVKVADDGHVHVDMTLTSPACPVAGTLPPEVEDKVRGVYGVTDATVEVVWDPPWTPDLMTEAAKLELGLM